ncbi:MAG: hypothetical protein Kow0092_02050 [Deferrisomatales bacterium]
MRPVAFAVALIALLLAPGTPPAGATAPLAPSWELKDLDGNLHRLEDWRGKWVLLKLGTTTCPACAEQLMEFDAHRDELDRLGVEVVDIYLREDRYSVRKYWERKALAFRPVILYDWKGSLLREYRVSLIPQLVLVDPEGAMVWTARYTEGSELVTVLRNWVAAGTSGGD